MVYLRMDTTDEITDIKDTAADSAKVERYARIAALIAETPPIEKPRPAHEKPDAVLYNQIAMVAKHWRVSRQAAIRRLLTEAVRKHLNLNKGKIDLLGGESDGGESEL